MGDGRSRAQQNAMINKPGLEVQQSYPAPNENNLERGNNKNKTNKKQNNQPKNKKNNNNNKKNKEK